MAAAAVLLSSPHQREIDMTTTSSPLLPSPSTIWGQSDGHYSPKHSRLHRTPQQITDMAVTDAATEALAQPSRSISRQPATALNTTTVSGDQAILTPQPKARSNSKAKTISTTKAGQPNTARGKAIMQGNKGADVLKTQRVSTKRHIMDSDSLCLKSAMPRRRDWTPPREVSCEGQPCSSRGSEVESTTITSNGFESESQSEIGFGSLVRAFGFREIPQIVKGDGSDDLCAKPCIPINRSPLKEVSLSPTKQSVKQKAKTITGQSTSAFAVEESQASGGLLAQSPLKIALNTPASPVKPARRRAKKAAPKPSTLLSPRAALDRMNGQDILFGTSSQLAREDSPTLIRDLQQAMTMSNQEVMSEDGDLPVQAFTGIRIHSAFAATKSLWSSATRDVDGCTLQAGVVDLVSSSPDGSQVESLLDPVRGPVHSEAEVTDDQDDSLVVLDQDESILPVHVPRQSSKEPSTEQHFDPQAALPKGTSITTLDQTALQQVLTVEDASITPKTSEPVDEFCGVTVSQLNKELALYGFKPMRGRTKMIDLLQRCRKEKAFSSSTVTVAASSAQSTSLLGSGTATETKRTRGRPRKTTPTTDLPSARSQETTCLGQNPASASTESKSKPKRRKTIPVEEISDSDPSTLPSPRSRRPKSAASPRLDLHALNPSVQHSDTPPDPDANSIAQKRLLFSHITRAITSQPRSRDKKNLSWHEKILLYDPIVLEDLAAWLNVEGLATVGIDHEVGPAELRLWCEERSVCCLSKLNLRGQMRKRY
ncbi:MAG: hypothetical protein M1825_002857 [Sarcosagium campestre]|nr:MAG: hypothetical protein M1825_002857 [Sarcosagium campestre]